jgi:hypothetical protein
MKHIIVLLLVYITYSAITGTLQATLKVTENATDAELDYIRTAFYESVDNMKKTDLLARYVTYRFTEDEFSYEPIILAYSGAIDALRAKHAFNPFSKLSYVHSSLKKLHRSVDQAPRDPEIRFLRFTVLHNIPSFLGYGSLLNEDRDMLYTLLIVEGEYAHFEKEMLIGVLEFLIESNRLTTEQEQLIHQLYTTIGSNGHIPSY